ncbi:MAG TPA: DUF309 domain-containing protein [Symbiobacteriaceae bacterium]|nr:DUF309 domain-containing protein [Symbiobacteriaceae bacterium]
MILKYGLAHFDQEDFWAACISLDEAWQDDPTDYCQGLIYLSGGFYHLQMGNLCGCRLLLELAVEWLAPFAWADREGSLAGAVAHTLTLLRAMRAGAGEFRSLAYPKLGEAISPAAMAA